MPTRIAVLGVLVRGRPFALNGQGRILAHGVDDEPHGGTGTLEREIDLQIRTIKGVVFDVA